MIIFVHTVTYTSLFGIVLKMVIKYNKNSELNCVRKKLILIMSDNFDRKVYYYY